MASIREDQQRSDQASTATRAALDRAVGFANALKQTTIYPSHHPRVRRGIEEFLAALAASATPYRLLLRDAEFAADGATFAAEHTALQWLADRYRDASLRMLEIEPRANVDVVLRLATFLREARRTGAAGAMKAWTGGADGVQLHAIVFEGRPDQPGDASSDLASTNGTVGGGGGSGPQLPAGVREALAAVRDSEAYQRHRAKIEQVARESLGNDHRDVDLLATIAHLLPAEIAHNPELVHDTVARVLEIVANEVDELTAGRRKVAGGRLLQRAIEVARSYFPSAVAQKPLARALPSGRPEDARITADLAALLAEYDEIPPDDRSLRDVLAASVHAALDRELLGVHLHLFAAGHDTAAAGEHTTRTLGRCAPSRPELLGAYLLAPNADRLPPARRLRFVQMLVDAGHRRVVAEHGYLDAELIVRGFPHSLAQAIAVFDGDARLPALLREALAMLARTLPGEIDGLLRTGLLKQATLLRALAAADSPEAHQLLLAAAASHALEARPVLLDCLRARQLPQPEALVLRTHPNAEMLPSAWLRALFSGCVRNRYDDALRAATGDLLIAALAPERDLAEAERLAIVDQLDELPRATAEPVLVGLTRGGWRQWSAKARAFRRAAKRTLQRLRARSHA
jgi:hypothetical protein